MLTCSIPVLEDLVQAHRIGSSGLDTEHMSVKQWFMQAYRLAYRVHEHKGEHNLARYRLQLRIVCAVFTSREHAVGLDGWVAPKQRAQHLVAAYARLPHGVEP